MYEYIKGKKVQIEEHMFSATELAMAYGISSLTNKPYAQLVSAILRKYESSKNLNLSEYYYLTGKAAMRVYPEILWRPALNEFSFQNNFEFSSPLEEKTFEYNGKRYCFLCSKNQQSKKIIPLIERGQKNE